MKDPGDDAVDHVDYEKHRAVTKVREGSDLIFAVHVDYEDHRVVMLYLDGNVVVYVD